MIKIVYVSCDIQGDCEFQILVEDQNVCNFKHNRLKGLAECLQKAADTVALSEWSEYVLINEVKGGSFH